MIATKVLEAQFTRIISGAGKMFGVKGFASGGFPEVNKPAIVGEKGPEIIVPTTQMKVIPNNKLQSSSANVSITQNISFGEGVNAAAKQAVLSMMPQIQALSVAAVVDAQKRGRA